MEFLARLSWIVPLALCVPLASGCRHAPAASSTGAAPAFAQDDPPADWTARAREAHDRGVAYLLRSQNKDGSWGSFVSARPQETWIEDYMAFKAYAAATTSLASMALQEPSRTNSEAEKALFKGLEYLLTAETSNRTSGEVFYDNWAHIYVVYGLSILARDPRFAIWRAQIEKVVLREIDRLASQEGADGGFGYYDFGYGLKHPSGFETTSFTTSAALVAFDEARKSDIAVPAPLVHDAIRAVERFRIGNGAYNYGNMPLDPVSSFNQVKGSLGRAQPCNLALWRWKRQVTKDDMRLGLKHLFESHIIIEIGRGRPVPHEGWYSTAGYYYLFGHYYASQVLRELDPQDRAQWCPRLAWILTRAQDPGGSWLDFPMYQFGQPYGTSFALLTLQVCLGETK